MFFQHTEIVVGDFKGIYLSLDFVYTVTITIRKYQVSNSVCLSRDLLGVIEEWFENKSQLLLFVLKAPVCV